MEDVQIPHSSLEIRIIGHHYRVAKILLVCNIFRYGILRLVIGIIAMHQQALLIAMETMVEMLMLLLPSVVYRISRNKSPFQETFTPSSVHQLA